MEKKMGRDALLGASPHQVMHVAPGAKAID